MKVCFATYWTVFGLLLCGFKVFYMENQRIEVSSASHTVNNFIISLFVMFGLTASTSTPLVDEVVIAIMYYVCKRTDWFGEITETGG